MECSFLSSAFGLGVTVVKTALPVNPALLGLLPADAEAPAKPRASLCSGERSLCPSDKLCPTRLHPLA